MVSYLRSRSWLAVASWLGRPTIVFRALLLLSAVLLPLHLPHVLTGVHREALVGWWSVPVQGAPEPAAVITRTIWHAADAGLMPGDRLVQIAGLPATPEAIAEVRASARAGDVLELVVERRQGTRVLMVPVRAGTASYAAYHWVRFGLAVLAWVVGVALIAWRGGRPACLLLGAGLLLIAPVTFRVDVPAAGFPMRAANMAWQVLATGYRFFFPAFLLHFLTLHFGGLNRVRSTAVWTGVYVALVAVLALTTGVFRDPHVWSTPGFERDLRAVAGLVFELLAVVALILVWRRVARLAMPLRWLAFSSFLFFAVGVVVSAMVLVAGERGATIDLLRQVKTLTLGPVIAAAAIYLVVGSDGDDVLRSGWRGRRRLATSAAMLLTVLYGFVVGGAAGVALSAMGWNLNGGEWILFGAVFSAAIVFSPVLRWAQEVVGRHMFADWIALEERTREFLSRVGAELEPRRIALAVSGELPSLLGTSSASLTLSSSLCEAWGIEPCADLETCPPSELVEQLARDSGSPRVLQLPVYGTDGRTLGLLRVERARHEPELEPPERRLLRTAAQGLSSALRNAETYLQLRKAQQDLAETERIASLGAMAGGLAHEIKNPLASLKMGVHILGRAGVDSVRLHRIQQDVRRIDDLVTGLLRFTHGGSVEETDVFDLETLVRTSVDASNGLAGDRGANLVIRPFPGEPVLVVGGPRQLRLIVSNVVTNALNAIDEGGTVSVRAEQRDDGVELVVEDDGPGIPPGLREAVFRSDYSTTPGGTGLGLVLARREIERLGGRIRIDAGAAGRGTVVRIWLRPLSRESRESQESQGSRRLAELVTRDPGLAASGS